MYKVVQIWPGLFVCKSGDIGPSHIWTTLYFKYIYFFHVLEVIINDPIIPFYII